MVYAENYRKTSDAVLLLRRRANFVSIEFAPFCVRRRNMLNLETRIDSMTNFKRQTAEYLERLHKTGEPVVLTVNGKAQVVVQDAGAYQKLLEAAARSDREETV